MKILHILNTDRFSGAENVVCRIIDLFRDDPDVEMAYCSRDGQIRSVLEQQGIRFFPVADLSRAELSRVLAEFRPQLLHAHDFRASIACSSFAGEGSVISHLHNNPPWLKHLGLRSLAYARTCSRYDRILTVSDSVFDEFILGKRFRKKQVCVGNPIDTAYVLRRAEANESELRRDLCFCGRLDEQKDPLLFLDILAELPDDVTAVMLGDGTLRAEVEAKREALGLGDRLLLCGFTDDPFPIMKNCRALCMPSRWEGFGLAAVEALALGLPVICSGAGGLSDIVRSDCGAICREKADYVRELSALLCDPDRLAAKRAAARARADELDNCASYKEVLQNVYRASVSDATHTDL